MAAGHSEPCFGEDRLVAELISGSNVNLRDEKYNPPPLGWAIHGWCDPPAGTTAAKPGRGSASRCGSERRTRVAETVGSARPSTNARGAGRGDSEHSRPSKT
jgi:hypothetical protein